MYTPEVIWKSPITMSLLTWIGVSIFLIDIYLFYRILKDDFKSNRLYLVIFILLFLFFILILFLRNITKKEMRLPLFFNYSINGFGRKIILEKIHINNCLKCGGKIKYHIKPVEWVYYYINGEMKRKITKNSPVLECKKNQEHCYEVV
ncbi:Uncharacterised protein [Streptobacillus moniliformis]|uniref:Uncharacterized protein n=2 Tax=Streptobacillus moniliformis TaxID=34105 RepID=D1AXW5_STRM9|nr:hypothetical protein [Streptobacillus moniliformis]ACZ01141.1 hypothetical protein Smon_0668 [Streptobacillus moniliformis DSM 12112]SQA13707.1 Uncharacterised protein [Streptobacillus moniliformis]